MSDYWNEVSRLSNASAAASAALKSFLERVPAPRTDQEISQYDEALNAALSATHEHYTFCEENSRPR